ncbi:MAG: 16S rRNA processing protein RimM [Fibrobacter sp.]|nr:16S rRNA processing protein RimM [Fibrobacter sp.]
MSESEDYITVCQLMRSHGVKGYIKAMPLTHDLSRHEKLSDVMLKKTNSELVHLTIEDSRLANNLWLLKFKGYDSPESVTHFVNGDLMIPMSERLPAPEGEYYLDDLAGFRVKLEDGRDVGEVLEVQELPTVEAFHIKFDADFQMEFSSKTVLAPWTGDCIVQVEEQGKYIVCNTDYLKSMCPEER